MRNLHHGSFLSPAKVNLFFRVLSKREDGYHEIATLMQAISLFDQLDIGLNTSGHITNITSDDASLPLDENNTIVKAVNVFKKHTGLKFSSDIMLKKNIPIGAGLGGGSGNGATTLWALNHLLRTNLSLETLQKLGSLVGSDVPFFFSSGQAYCTGKGEKVQDMHPCCFLTSFCVIKPELSLSTPLVYRHCTPHAVSNKDPLEILKVFQSGLECVNDLEVPAFGLIPELAILKKTLEVAGFKHVMMTGSGSAFISFGQNIKACPHKISCFPVNPVYRKLNAWYEERPELCVTSLSSRECT